MPNLNLAIKYIQKLDFLKKRAFKKNTLNILFLIIAIVYTSNVSFGQFKTSVPTEFNFISINARALEKQFEYTIDKDTPTTPQQFTLDKTGFILHLKPAQINNTNISKLRIFSSDGTEVEIFNFLDNSYFGLVDPQKTYIIAQEINPPCDKLIKTLNLNPNSAICPNAIVYKLFDNIMINSDTSFTVPFLNLTEFYSIPLSIPNNTNLLNNDFNLVNISDTSSNETLSLASLLSHSELCIISSLKTKNPSKATDCTFTNKNIQSFIVFNNALKSNAICFIQSSSGQISSSSSGSNLLQISTLSLEDLTSSSGSYIFPSCSSGTITCNQGKSICINNLQAETQCKNIEGLFISGCKTNFAFFKNTDSSLLQNNLFLVFPYIQKTFSKLNHEVLIQVKKKSNPQNSPIEISTNSPQKLFLDSYNYSLIENLGSLSTLKSPINRTSFNLTVPIVLNQELNKVEFSVEPEEGSITPFSNINNISVLSKLNITGSEKNNFVRFKLSANNNVKIKNLSDTIPEKNSKQQTQPNQKDKITISSYLPKTLSNIGLDKVYTFVEQDVTPSTDKEGKPIDLVTNKSKSEIIISTVYMDIDLNNVTTPISLESQMSSLIIGNQQLQNQIKLSGFVISPDRRPILEDKYKATISISKLFKIKENTFVNWVYSDLKAKDEPAVTNFFSFSFLPTSTYQCNLKFDSNREALLKKYGVIKK